MNRVLIACRKNEVFIGTVTLGFMELVICSMSENGSKKA